MSVSQITAPDLSPGERVALAQMLTQLDARQASNRKRIEYYNREKRLRKFGFSVPPQLRKLAPILGWPAKTVTSLSSRLTIEEFLVSGMENGDDRIKRIVEDNALEIEMPQTHKSALQIGVAFAFVTAGDPTRREPSALISVRSGTTATALWDKRARRPRCGLSVVDFDGEGQPSVMNMYIPGQVISLTKMNSGWRVQRIGHSIDESLVTPIVHDPDLDREFGTSRITQTVMDLTDSAARTMLRAEVSGEFFSTPQRWMLNLTQKQYDKVVENGSWQSILGSIFATERDGTDVPNAPKAEVGQFPQQSQEPHIAQLRSIATMFAGETGLPLNSLGVVQDNPASADAIRASKEDMILVAQDCQRTFGYGWKNVIRQAVMVQEGLSELPDELRGMKARWTDAANPSQHERSAAVTEQVREGILPPNDDVTYELLGYDPNMIARLRTAWGNVGPSDAERLADALSRQAQPTLPPAGAQQALTA